MIEHLPSMYRAWGPPYIENKTVRLERVQAQALESLVCYIRNLDLTIWPWGSFLGCHTGLGGQILVWKVTMIQVRNENHNTAKDNRLGKILKGRN